MLPWSVFIDIQKPFSPIGLIPYILIYTYVPQCMCRIKKSSSGSWPWDWANCISYVSLCISSQGVWIGLANVSKLFLQSHGFCWTLWIFIHSHTEYFMNNRKSDLLNGVCVVVSAFQSSASRLVCHVADWMLQFLSRAKPFSFSAAHRNRMAMSVCANCCPAFRIAICQSHSLVLDACWKVMCFFCVYLYYLLCKYLSPIFSYLSCSGPPWTIYSWWRWLCFWLMWFNLLLVCPTDLIMLNKGGY